MFVTSLICAETSSSPWVLFRCQAFQISSSTASLPSFISRVPRVCPAPVRLGCMLSSSLPATSWLPVPSGLEDPSVPLTYPFFLPPPTGTFLLKLSFIEDLPVCQAFDIKLLIHSLSPRFGVNFFPPPDWTQPPSFCGSHFPFILPGPS